MKKIFLLFYFIFLPLYSNSYMEAFNSKVELDYEVCSNYEMSKEYKEKIDKMTLPEKNLLLDQVRNYINRNNYNLEEAKDEEELIKLGQKVFLSSVIVELIIISVALKSNVDFLRGKINNFDYKGLSIAVLTGIASALSITGCLCSMDNDNNRFLGQELFRKRNAQLKDIQDYILTKKITD